MPSPFPGMDPYLEGELWQEFHETLAGAIREQLLKVLPPRYVVPLLPPDEDVPLDLQRAVNACYDLVRYERLLDYTAEPPPPPLSEADMSWLREKLAARATTTVL